MPYWGANVRSNDYVIQAKIHGEQSYPCPDDLIEYLTNLANSTNVYIYDLAKYYAEKIAKAFAGIPFARWVTVDILTTSGMTFGHTELVEETEVHEQSLVREHSGK